MADLYLVRHGQASFGAADYDKLSALGERQSRLLGEWLAACGVVPDVVASGPQRRQVDTARLCVAVCGGPAEDAFLQLDGLGEYDHDSVVALYEPRYADSAAMHAEFAAQPNPRRAFHAMYVKAIARWTGGDHDADYAESWPAFRARVGGAVRQLAKLDARTVIAFTSGGPITAAVQTLTGVPDARAFDLNWPLVNAGITRLRFSASDGLVTLATYNAHPHLDRTGDPALITYR
jgi:broad specificity phosphatase PhoE